MNKAVLCGFFVLSLFSIDTAIADDGSLHWGPVISQGAAVGDEGYGMFLGAGVRTRPETDDPVYPFVDVGVGGILGHNDDNPEDPFNGFIYCEAGVCMEITDRLNLDYGIVGTSEGNTYFVFGVSAGW